MRFAGRQSASRRRCPISILVPTKNEGANLARCLDAVAKWADEIVVVDSQSTDETVEVAESYRAEVIQFIYRGGWPKKRQWALDEFSWRNEWILLLDADEIVTDAGTQEIELAIGRSDYDGYWIPFQVYFLGKLLRFGDTRLMKQSLFRRGKGRYERRLDGQDTRMSDIEVHEHVVVDGPSGRLRNPVRHENVHCLDRYIEKHNAYSNWEAKVFLEGDDRELAPAAFGNQAQRRRWLKRRFLKLPGSPLLWFAYNYFFRLGVLDGRAGLVYSTFRAVQMFHVKAKIYELQQRQPRRCLQRRAGGVSPLVHRTTLVIHVFQERVVLCVVSRALLVVSFRAWSLA